MWQITLNGPRYFNTTFVLPAGTTKLGREDDNDIVLTGNSVSRHHVQLDVRGLELFAKDLGSRNGSQINGRKLEGTSLLRPGDTLSLGENQITVREPARVENVLAESVDPRAGGLRRSIERDDRPPEVRVARPMGESRMLAQLEEELRSPSRLGEPREALSSEARSLILLIEAAERVNGASALQELLDGGLTWAKEHLRLSSAVVLLSHPSGVMVPVSVRHQEGLAQGEVPVSDTVVLAALQRKSALAVRKQQAAPKPVRHSVTVDGGDTVLCIPIGEGGKYTGALYFNRVGGSELELADQLDLSAALAHVIGIAVAQFHKEDRAQKQERLRKTLERFHGPDIAHRKRAPMPGRSHTSPLEEKTITVLIADMHDFLSVIKTSTPEKVASLLTEFYDRTSTLIFSFEGTVDRYMGESVLAIFGAPVSKGDDALRALRCALEIRSSWDTAMKRRPSDERCHLSLGVATGQALVGTVGSDVRLDYTALGEPVTLVQWLVGIANPGQVLVADSTLEAAESKFEVIAQKERVMKQLRRKVSFVDVLVEDKSQITITGERPTRAKKR